MPTFSTPDPIDLAISVQVGRIDVIASDRVDTVVTVAPSSPRSNDAKAAEQTRIAFEHGRLSVIGPKPRISWIGPNAGDSVDVKVELPSASRLAAELAVGGVYCAGALGATRIKAAMGPVELDTTGDLWLRVAHGSATITSVEGGADVTAAYGQIRFGTIAGDALLKSSYGGVHLEKCGGDLETKLSYGDLAVDRALASVTAKTAFGATVLGEVSNGSVQVDSGYGPVTVGVRAGVAAWLDLASKNGRVRNELADEDAPPASEETVAVRVRTQGGDVTVHRAH